MDIKPFVTTGIGSLPHTDAKEACSLIVSSFDIVFWPQLPRLSFRESMLAQFAEGMPNIIVDEDNNTIYAQRHEEDTTGFYESYSEDKRIAMSKDCAKGLYEFISSFRNRRFDTIKGQIAGPLTLTLSIKDGSGRYIFFDEEIREIALMSLKAKILWQIDVLRQFSDNIIIFIDEPIFTAIGSTTYLGVSEDEVLRILTDCVELIRGQGAFSCIHCCGKSDWGLVIKSGVDMLSFDAFEYFETFSLYSNDIKGFLDKGGYLCWGIVPTSEIIKDVSYRDVLAKFHDSVDKLSNLIDKGTLLHHSILSPSCGMGSRDIDDVKKILDIQKALKEELTKSL
ncbi:MAG: hypothetical protein SNJ53_02705 [Thermodesulfovibrionales bacterium]